MPVPAAPKIGRRVADFDPAGVPVPLLLRALVDDLVLDDAGIIHVIDGSCTVTSPLPGPVAPTGRYCTTCPDPIRAAVEAYRHWETTAWAARHLNSGTDLDVETARAVASTLTLLRAPLRQGRYGGPFQHAVRELTTRAQAVFRAAAETADPDEVVRLCHRDIAANHVHVTVIDLAVRNAHPVAIVHSEWIHGPIGGRNDRQPLYDAADTTDPALIDGWVQVWDAELERHAGELAGRDGWVIATRPAGRFSTSLFGDLFDDQLMLCDPDVFDQPGRVVALPEVLCDDPEFDAVTAPMPAAQAKAIAGHARAVDVTVDRSAVGVADLLALAGRIPR